MPVIACLVLSASCSAAPSAPDNDLIKGAVETAKEKFAADMERYEIEVTLWFGMREDAARKDGNKKLVDLIKAERSAFGNTGELPKSAPAALRQKPALARAAVEKAYETAIKEYTKIRKDDEADAMEKALTAFVKGQLPKGAANPAAQSMRWVVRVVTANATDYLSQLAAMNASILVVDPAKPKQAVYVPNLRNLGSQRAMTEADQRTMASSFRLTDSRKESVEGVAKALKLDFTPTAFMAVFPAALADELAEKERSFRNRKPDEIKETIFRVSIVKGKPVIVVLEQTTK